MRRLCDITIELEEFASPGLIRLAAVTGFLFLFFLMFSILADYLTRLNGAQIRAQGARAPN